MVAGGAASGRRSRPKQAPGVQQRLTARRADVSVPFLMAPHSVALVLDPDFGARLYVLADQMHVWIVRSPTNDPIIDAFHAVSTSHSLERGVTSITLHTPVDGPEMVSLLEDVDLHHGIHGHSPPWTTLHLFGMSESPALYDALAQFGIDRIESASDRVVAYRPDPSDGPA